MSQPRWKVTGLTPQGRRFKPIHTNSATHAFGINLFRGTIWIREGNKWRVVRRVRN